MSNDMLTRARFDEQQGRLVLLPFSPHHLREQERAELNIHSSNNTHFTDRSFQPIQLHWYWQTREKNTQKANSMTNWAWQS